MQQPPSEEAIGTHRRLGPAAPADRRKPVPRVPVRIGMEPGWRDHLAPQPRYDERGDVMSQVGRLALGKPASEDGRRPPVQRRGQALVVEVTGKARNTV